MGSAKIRYVLNESVLLPRVFDDLVTDLVDSISVWPEWSVGEDNMSSIESRL